MRSLDGNAAFVKLLVSVSQRLIAGLILDVIPQEL